ncbi:GerMN domain-containing protein [Arthrobacter ginkgonis]
MTRRQPRLRPRARAATLALAACLAMVSACAEGPGGAAATMPAPTEASQKVPAAASGTALEPVASRDLSPVYWLGERDSTVYLYREYVRAEDQGDPVTTSIKHMLEQPPEDPDFFNVWSPASRIGTSISADNVITVDLSADAFARRLDAGLAQRAIQQLVFTATSAAANAGLLGGSSAQVVLLVDGHADYEAFGHVPLDGAMSRDATFCAPIWVLDPGQDRVAADNAVRIHGYAAKFPAGTRWEVQRTGSESDTVVASGAVETGEADLGANEFEISLALPRGSYRLAVWGTPSTGTERLAEDTKDFTVSGD